MRMGDNGIKVSRPWLTQLTHHAIELQVSLNKRHQSPIGFLAMTRRKFFQNL